MSSKGNSALVSGLSAILEEMAEITILSDGTRSDEVERLVSLLEILSAAAVENESTKVGPLVSYLISMGNFRVGDCRTDDYRKFIDLVKSCMVGFQGYFLYSKPEESLKFPEFETQIPFPRPESDGMTKIQSSKRDHMSPSAADHKSDSELICEFVSISTEQLAQAEEFILRMEDEGLGGTAVDEVFRAFHTIKGSAGLFGMVEIHDFSHEVEYLFEVFRSGSGKVSRTFVDLGFECVDIVREMISSLSTRQGSISITKGCRDRIASALRRIARVRRSVAVQEGRLAPMQQTPAAVSPLPEQVLGDGTGPQACQTPVDQTASIVDAATMGQVEERVLPIPEPQHEIPSSPDKGGGGLPDSKPAAKSVADAEEVEESGTSPSGATDILKHLTFTLDDQVFAIPIDCVHEIIGNPEITPLPLVPPSVMGMFNLRGKIATIFDLRRCLGITATDPSAADSACDERKCVLVLSGGRGGKVLVGILVDGARDVVGIDLDLIEKPSGNLASASRYVKGIARLTASGSGSDSIDARKAVARTTDIRTAASRTADTRTAASRTAASQSEQVIMIIDEAAFLESDQGGAK